MKPRLALLITMVFGAAVMRLLPHLPNFTPIAAMALFGGAYFSDKRLAFLIPFSALFLSDLILGLHAQMPVVYASIALIVCIGFSLQKRQRWLPIAGAALASSVLFFMTTNFGVWLFSSWYPRNMAGLIACYVAAIPFFGNTLLGDALYTAVLFGGVALAARRLSAEAKTAPASA